MAAPLNLVYFGWIDFLHSWVEGARDNESGEATWSVEIEQCCKGWFPWIQFVTDGPLAQLIKSCKFARLLCIDNEGVFFHIYPHPFSFDCLRPVLRLFLLFWVLRLFTLLSFDCQFGDSNWQFFFFSFFDNQFRDWLLTLFCLLTVSLETVHTTVSLHYWFFWQPVWRLLTLLFCLLTVRLETAHTVFLTASFETAHTILSFDC